MGNVKIIGFSSHLNRSLRGLIKYTNEVEEFVLGDEQNIGHIQSQLHQADVLIFELSMAPRGFIHQIMAEFRYPYQFPIVLVDHYVDPIIAKKINSKGLNYLPLTDYARSINQLLKEIINGPLPKVGHYLNNGNAHSGK